MSEQTNLPCGHPAACGDPCGWCADIAQAEANRTLKAEINESLVAERDKLAAELAAVKARLSCGHPALCADYGELDDPGECVWCDELAAIREIMGKASLDILRLRDERNSAQYELTAAREQIKALSEKSVPPRCTATPEHDSTTNQPKENL